MKASDPAASGPYRLLAELGSGGMGRVLLGAAPDGRLVAVKHVHAALAVDEGFRARFRREVAASRKVSGAYTAAVMDSDADAPTPWLASVFVAGPSLGAAVAAVGPLPEPLLRRLAAGLASALAEIHRVGLVHRDLKPDNVLLAEDGVRVIDFGIARAAWTGAEDEGEPGLTRTGLVIGSPAFMSPEQAEGERLTAAGDVFSLGSVLVLAATGRSPFVGSSTLRTLYDVVHAEPDLSGVPTGLRGIVERCLAKDPAARPSPAELLELLGPVAPTGRQWPPAVHRMIAAQRADIDRLLDGPEDKAGEAAPTPPDVKDAEDVKDVQDAEAAEDEPGPAEGPRTRVEPAPPRRVPRRKGAVVACVLAAAALGGTAYGLSPAGTTGGGSSATGGQDSPSDRYLRLPTCDDLAVQLPLQPRDKGGDSHSVAAGEARTACTWLGAADGGARSARVRWDLLDYSGSRNATTVQRESFRAQAADGVRASRLGFGDEAFRGAADTTTVCSLSVRDGNLIVRVDLGSGEFPAVFCEASATDIARAALTAVPH